MRAPQKMLLLVLVGAASIASAQTRSTPRPKQIPLLPPRETLSASLEEGALEMQTESPTHRSLAYGAEFGFLSQKTSNNGGLFGMRFYVGGRIFLYFALFDRIYLKPSVGYFFAREGQGGVSLTNHNFEGGLAVHYVLSRSARTRWVTGISQGFDVTLTHIAYGNGSGTNPLDYRYRVGPLIGFDRGIGSGKRLLMNLDVQAAFADSDIRPYVGMSVGVFFY